MAESAVLIGAGLVGLATARALQRAGVRRVTVLEAEPRVAAHQSGHNSGVLHSGLYYKEGSHKAGLCVRGREAMLAYCAEKGIRHALPGKLVVATDDAERERLDELERRGRANGLPGLERIDARELRRREPEVAGIDALWVRATGLVDYPAVARALAEDVTEGGGAVHLAEPARAIRHTGASFEVTTPKTHHAADLLINCAGLQADRVARLAGLRPEARIVPFRGEYMRLTPAASARIRGIVYPVPDPNFPFLGVHFTRGLDDEVSVGPNAVLALSRHAYTRGHPSARDLLSLATNPGFWRFAKNHATRGAKELIRARSRTAFLTAARRLLPSLRRGDLQPAGAGIRAQALHRDGTLEQDFLFAEDSSTPGALHVLSAPSPGATACLAIGESIAERVQAPSY